MNLSVHFPFVGQLIGSLDHLQRALLSGRFPALDDEVRESAEVITVLSQASEWASRVLEAYGSSDSDLVGRGDPRPVLTWFQGSARQQAGGTPRLDRAADVLGEIPQKYSACHAVAIVLMCAPQHRNQGKLRRPFGSRDLIDPSVANWTTIRDDLAGLRLMAITQAMQLIALVRDRIGSLERALIPEIRKITDLSWNRVELEVRLAGAARNATVPNAVAEFLDNLAQDGRALVLRRTKSQLEQDIPELSMWLRALKREGQSIGENEGLYGVPKEVQMAIHRPIAKKCNA